MSHSCRPPRLGTHLLLLSIVSVGSLSARYAITEPGTASYWPPTTIIGYVVGALLLAVIGCRSSWMIKHRNSVNVYSHIGKAIGIGLLLAPFAWSVFGFTTSARFLPLEQAAIAALTNVAFFLGAFPGISRNDSAAVAVSFSLALAALMLGDHAAIAPLTTVFGGLCAVWLAHRYWRDSSAPTSNRDNAHPPVMALGCFVVFLVCVSVAFSGIRGSLAKTWGEWMPSSGGSLRANSAALLGAGDGDWAVSGPNARGTGAVDSEYFLESKLASIYDVLTDAYGEPLTAKDLFRSISISIDQMIDFKGGKAPDFGEAGRQFSMYRQTQKKRDRSQSVQANALLYVEGDAPLHLAMTIYDKFDGVSWHEPEESIEICRFEAREPDLSWLWLLKDRDHEFLGGSRIHTLRFGRLSTERIPLPSHLERLRLGQAGGANARQWAMETFAWIYEGVLRARHCLPSGTYLEVGSHPVDPSNLIADESLFTPTSVNDPHLDIPEHLSASATALASQFTHLPRGWEQIDGLVKHLRLHYAHDRDAILPPTCDDPIHHLLHQARGGPAYQFATAAALALRSLGYRTRVVSGFYVNPRNYVAAAGYTTVKTEDAHFWIEVQTMPGVWISLDPTPGYEVSWYRPTILARIFKATADAKNWIVAHPVASTAIVIISLLLWWRRWRIYERLMTLWCVYWPFRSDDDRLVHTLRLLDVRSRLCGQRRPLSATPRFWYGGIDEPACQSFLSHLYESLYGPVRGAGANSESVTRLLCRAAIRTVSLGRLRARLLATR